MCTLPKPPAGRALSEGKDHNTFEFLLVSKNGKTDDVNFKAFREIALSRLTVFNPGYIRLLWGFKNITLFGPHP